VLPSFVLKVKNGDSPYEMPAPPSRELLVVCPQQNDAIMRALFESDHLLFKTFETIGSEVGGGSKARWLERLTPLLGLLVLL
jgi:hypothetical protein